jgi:hypothetical protein
VLDPFGEIHPQEDLIVANKGRPIHVLSS